MDTMKILLAVLNEYAGEAENGYSYLTANHAQTLFVIVSIGNYKGKHLAFTDLMIHIIDDKIIIDEDRNSRPFYEALMEAGIPREQIILAYAGEQIPSLVSE
jgi:hypothetical protein